MLTEYLAYVVFSSLIFSAGWVFWASVFKNKSAFTSGLLILMVSIIANLILVLFSTELIGSPILEISVRDLLVKFALPLTAFVTVAFGLAFANWRHQTGRKAIAISLISVGWVTGISALSLVGLIWISANAEKLPSANSDEDIETEEKRSILEMAAETLPDGFELKEILVKGTLEQPVAFTVGESGEIYISTFSGGIYKLAPSPWDPDNPELSVFVPEIEQVTGMVFHDGTLYANGSGSLVALKDEDNDGNAENSETLIEGLPSRVYDHHSNNGLVLGDDGRFYFGLGGTTDHGPETDPMAGTILAYDPIDRSLNVFAHGLRNPYDLTFCPGGGKLFATDNGPDRLDETLRFVPPDELNLVEEGLNYGYPDFFGFPPPWSDTVSPIALMETAGVPAGIICYENGNFPAEYANNLFVALAGGSNPATGHKIVRVELAQQEAGTVGMVTDFLTGLGRPVDLIQYQDGSLLVLDYDLGQVYQVVFTGSGY